MPAARELTFQLERFEWIASDRLELAGRWNGLRGRRIAPPVLAFDADGRRHRLRAMPGGQLDERWRATFAWDGPAVDIERAELEVGRTLVVDLPAPRRRSSADRPAEPLEERLAAAEAEAEAAREEVAQLREDFSTAAEETEQALTAARETEAALREEAAGLKAELERAQGLLEQRESQLGATRAGLERERNELRELRTRLDETAEELEREREESRRLREAAAEPATEAHTVEGASGEEEWPLEPAPLPPATAAATHHTTSPQAEQEEGGREERSHPVTNGDTPSIEVWAARVSSTEEEEKGGEAPRTLELPGLEAVKEKGAKALSSLLGHDGDTPQPVPARPRATAASRAGTRVRAPRGARSRTVRQHSTQAIWAMRIAAVAMLLVILVLLAVVLDVIS